MECPKCEKCKSLVIDSRILKDNIGNDAVRRRRVCPKCHYRFSSYEQVVTDDVILVNPFLLKKAFDLAEEFKSAIMELKPHNAIHPERSESYTKQTPPSVMRQYRKRKKRLKKLRGKEISDADVEALN